jgi:hypothetical protein
VVRSVAIPLVVLVVAYLLLRRVGPRPVLAFLLGWALVAGAYVGIFHAQHGTWGFTRSGGRFLYARVAPFAECDRLGTLPRDERSLCPDPARPRSTNAYLWGKTSPIAGLPDSADARLRDFARRVIRHQPLDYVRTVASGTLHYFRPGHPIGFNDYPIAPWQWPVDPHHWGYPGYRGPIRPSDPAAHAKHKLIEPGPDVSPMVSRPRLDAGASRVLHDYQRVAYTWGPLLALCLLLVLVALVLRRGAARLRLDAALLAALTLAALATSQALSVFSYRYGMIAIFGLPVAAALAATSLTRCSSTPPPTSP